MARLVWQRHLAGFYNLFSFATIVVPTVVMAPGYFAGTVQFGQISQAGIAFTTVFDGAWKTREQFTSC